MQLQKSKVRVLGPFQKNSRVMSTNFLDSMPLDPAPVIRREAEVAHMKDGSSLMTGSAKSGCEGGSG